MIQGEKLIETQTFPKMSSAYEALIGAYHMYFYVVYTT